MKNNFQNSKNINYKPKKKLFSLNKSKKIWCVNELTTGILRTFKIILLYILKQYK